MQVNAKLPAYSCTDYAPLWLADGQTDIQELRFFPLALEASSANCYGVHNVPLSTPTSVKQHLFHHDGPCWCGARKHQLCLKSCNHLADLSMWLVEWQMSSIPTEESNFTTPVIDRAWAEELACSRFVVFSQTAFHEAVADTAHVCTRISRRVYVHYQRMTAITQ